MKKETEPLKVNTLGESIPEFVPLYTEMRNDYALTWLETALFGFVRLTSRPNIAIMPKNALLEEMFDVNTSSISSAISTLKSIGLIKIEIINTPHQGNQRYIYVTSMGLQESQ